MFIFLPLKWMLYISVMYTVVGAHSIDTLYLFEAWAMYK